MGTRIAFQLVRFEHHNTLIVVAGYKNLATPIEDAPDKRPKPKDAKPGRPRVEESISDAIIRIRKETGWGYTKIVQAMRRLGHKIFRQTVKNVLVEANFGPEPHDHPDTWSEFIKRHAETMWQCDFACKRKWTVKGMVDLYFLVFIHLGTRRIWVSPCTANPSGEWTTQQARNFDMFLQDKNLPCTILQRDQDTNVLNPQGVIYESLPKRVVCLVLCRCYLSLYLSIADSGSGKGTCAGRCIHTHENFGRVTDKPRGNRDSQIDLSCQGGRRI